MSNLAKISKHLSLSDAKGNLSITNLAMFVIVGKVAVSPLDWQAAILLFITCANYAFKRHVSAKQETEATKEVQIPEAVNVMLGELHSKVNSLILKGK